MYTVYIYITINNNTMKATKTAQELQVGDSFISKGSKMTLARIKAVNEDSIVMFVLQHVMSSYTTVTIKKSEIVSSF